MHMPDLGGIFAGLKDLNNFQLLVAATIAAGFLLLLWYRLSIRRMRTERGIALKVMQQLDRSSAQSFEQLQKMFEETGKDEEEEIEKLRLRIELAREENRAAELRQKQLPSNGDSAANPKDAHAPKLAS